MKISGPKWHHTQTSISGFMMLAADTAEGLLKVVLGSVVLRTLLCKHVGTPRLEPCRLPSSADPPLLGEGADEI